MAVRPTEVDRAAGVLLGAACGDALGVPYGAGPPVGEAVMKGGSDRGPGEWTDDSQLSVCVAQVAADGADLAGEEGLDRVAELFLHWRASVNASSRSQTSQVLIDAADRPGRPADRLRAAAAALDARTGRTAGNGALMRTCVVGIHRPHDRDATAAAARAVAGLTHADPLAADTCVLWSEAIRVAVTESRLDLASGLDLVSSANRGMVARAIRKAEAEPAAQVADGFILDAVRAAWVAITQTDRSNESAMHLQRGLQRAVRNERVIRSAGTVAGSLLGGRYGASAVPTQWRRLVHGWPGLRAHDLVELAVCSFAGGRVPGAWPSVPTMYDPAIRRIGVPHPVDPDIILGSISDLASVRELGVDAVISACALGLEDIPAAGLAPRDHVELWLNEADESNPHLDFVLDDASSALRQFRAEDKRVLVHSRSGTQRVAAVALRYAVDLGVAPALAERSVLESLEGRGIDTTSRLWRVAAYGG